ncbi:glycine--tRNA ligase subunit beta [bacterium]|nr:glycine--tRNA ligase subunit beta [bacterium]
MEREDLVVEIGCEDLPTWTGEFLKKKWVNFLSDILKENRVDYVSLRFFSTSRRLIVYLGDVAKTQGDISSEITGPPVGVAIDGEGNYTSAAKGFAASNNVSLDELFIKEKSGKKVVALIKKTVGIPIKDILGNILVESVKKIEIPRSMKWQKDGFRFIRPIRWVFAMLGEEIIDLELAGIKSGPYSYGHRVLSCGKFKPASARDYIDKILKHFVIFDPDLRLEFTKTIINKEISSEIVFDEKELVKILNALEYPFVLKCELKDEYMALPQEVVCAVIRNLNGLPLFNQDQQLLPYYIVVSDGVKSEEIKRNYLSVLSSKMEDAIFFMDKDLSVPFKEYSNELKRISYHPKWGSVYARVERFKKIANLVTEFLGVSEAVKDNINEIVLLCKNDLATLMVAEFPSLEGIIGRVYAEKNGYNSVVAKGIEQHYFPKSSGDILPESFETSVASVVVRIETLCGMFLDDIKIKGTGDPYGIKKVANGLIEILWSENLNIPIKELLDKSLLLFVDNPNNVSDKIFQFLYQRIENILANEGFSSGIRKAVISSEKENFLNIRLKTVALKTFFSEGEGLNLLVPFIRVANILKQADEKKICIGDSVVEKLLSDPAEKEFYSLYKETGSHLRSLYNNGEYISFLKNLGKWRNVIDTFFDDVLIMCDDEKIRENRLALLREVNEIFSLFADFSLIPLVEVDNV